MTKNRIRLAAFDMDGTLLNSRKELTDHTLSVLNEADRAGMLLVPATGRYFSAMPEQIRNLPFLKYAIVLNGAEVHDVAAGRSIVQYYLPYDGVLEFCDYLDTLPVLYDCYIEDRGYMTASHFEKIDTWIIDDHIRTFVKSIRTPVPCLKDKIRDYGRDIPKMQIFPGDPKLRERLFKELPKRFPFLILSASCPENIEVNAIGADKGSALKGLTAYLGMDPAETAAFGDGLNDIPMLEAAGIGVAMANSVPETLAAADTVTLSCDEDGVAAYLEQILREQS